MARYKSAATVKRYAYGLICLALNITGVIPSQILRKFIYRYVFRVKSGPGCVFYGHIEFRSPWKIEIGANSVIGRGCLLDGRKGLRIGANVNISSGAWIWTLQHDIGAADFTAVGAPVEVHDRAWICARAMILPGAVIGEGAVVGAGAVVNRTVKPFSIVAGVPAREVGQRSRQLTYKLGLPVPFL